jgi:hypothetical protein
VADTVKLVWFVPPSALASTREAVFAAGGGRVGSFSRCSFAVLGEGTSLGGEGTTAAVGEPGVDERVTEYRVEIVVPVARLAAVVAALRLAHPYEEPSYDVTLRLDA